MIIGYYEGKAILLSTFRRGLLIQTGRAPLCHRWRCRLAGGA